MPAAVDRGTQTLVPLSLAFMTEYHRLGDRDVCKICKIVHKRVNYKKPSSAPAGDQSILPNDPSTDLASAARHELGARVPSTLKQVSFARTPGACKIQQPTPGAYMSATRRLAALLACFTHANRTQAQRRATFLIHMQLPSHKEKIMRFLPQQLEAAHSCSLPHAPKQ